MRSVRSKRNDLNVITQVMKSGTIALVRPVIVTKLGWIILGVAALHGNAAGQDGCDIIAHVISLLLLSLFLHLTQVKSYTQLQKAQSRFKKHYNMLNHNVWDQITWNRCIYSQIVYIHIIKLQLVLCSLNTVSSSLCPSIRGTIFEGSSTQHVSAVFLGVCTTPRTISQINA